LAEEIILRAITEQQPDTLQELLEQAFASKSTAAPDLSNAGAFLQRCGCDEEVLWVTVEVTDTDATNLGREQRGWATAIRWDDRHWVALLHQTLFGNTANYQKTVDKYGWITLSDVMSVIATANNRARFFVIDLSPESQIKNDPLWPTLFNSGDLVLIETNEGATTVMYQNTQTDQIVNQPISDFGDASHSHFWIRDWLGMLPPKTGDVGYYVGVQDDCGDVRIWAGLSSTMKLSTLSSIEFLCRTVDGPQFRKAIASVTGNSLIFMASEGVWLARFNGEEGHIHDRVGMHVMASVIGHSDRRLSISELYADHARVTVLAQGSTTYDMMAKLHSVSGERPHKGGRNKPSSTLAMLLNQKNSYKKLQRLLEKRNNRLSPRVDTEDDDAEIDNIVASLGLESANVDEIRKCERYLDQQIREETASGSAESQEERERKTVDRMIGRAKKNIQRAHLRLHDHLFGYQGSFKYNSGAWHYMPSPNVKWYVKDDSK